MYCIYLKKRKNKPFCKLLNNEISFSCCQGCDKKEYKKSINWAISNKKSAFYVKKSPKTSKKSQKLKKQTYKHQKADRNRFSIIVDDLSVCCYPNCRCNHGIIKHEVFYGSYRHTSINYGLVIPLCEVHHTKGNFAIHHNRKFDLKMKFLAQDIFVKKYSLELFIKEFGMDYIEKYKKRN